MVNFGSVDFNKPEEVAFATERLKPFLELVGNRELYMPPIDVLPTEHSRIFKAEWYQSIAGINVIVPGFVAVPKATVNGSNIFHADTMDDALQWYLTQGIPAERLMELFHRRSWFTVGQGRALGWCETGIMNWAGSHLDAEWVSKRAVPIYVLWRVVDRIPEAGRSGYEKTLHKMLCDHPLRDNETWPELDADTQQGVSEAADA